MDKESLLGSFQQLLTGFNNCPQNEHPGKVSQLTASTSSFFNESMKTEIVRHLIETCTHLLAQMTEWMLNMFLHLFPLYLRSTHLLIFHTWLPCCYLGLVSAVHSEGNKACWLHWLSEWKHKEYSNAFWLSHNEMSHRHDLLNNFSSINNASAQKLKQWHAAIIRKLIRPLWMAWMIHIVFCQCSCHINLSETNSSTEFSAVTIMWEYYFFVCDWHLIIFLC